MLCHFAGCLVLLTAQLFRDSCSGLPWRPQASLPLRASLAHFAQVPLAPRLPVWVSSHFALLFSAVGPGLFGVACLGGVVPGALLRSSSPALSGIRYGLKGSSANRVGVSTHLLYSPCTYIVLESRRPGPLFIFGLAEADERWVSCFAVWWRPWHFMTGSFVHRFMLS